MSLNHREDVCGCVRKGFPQEKFAIFGVFWAKMRKISKLAFNSEYWVCAPSCVDYKQRAEVVNLIRQLICLNLLCANSNYKWLARMVRLRVWEFRLYELGINNKCIQSRGFPARVHKCTTFHTIEQRLCIYGYDL
jgi:hypothetical protein